MSLLTSLWPASASMTLAPLAPLLTSLTIFVQYIVAWPEALYHLPSLPAVVIIGYYGLCVCVLFMPRQRFGQRCRWSAFSLCALLMLGGVGWTYLTSQPNQLRVTFLDVGTGDAILIQTPEGHSNY